MKALMLYDIEVNGAHTLLAKNKLHSSLLLQIQTK